MVIVEKIVNLIAIFFISLLFFNLIPIALISQNNNVLNDKGVQIKTNNQLDSLCIKLIMHAEKASNKKDTIEQLFKKAKDCITFSNNDKIMLLYYEKYVSYLIQQSRLEESLNCLKSATKLARLTHNEKELATFYTQTASVYYFKDSLSLAIKYIDSAAKLFEKTGDTTKIIASMLHYAVLCSETENYELMDKTLLSINLKYNKKLNQLPYLKGRVLSMESIYFILNESYEQAIEKLEMSIFYLKKVKNNTAKMLLIYTYNKLVIVYQDRFNKNKNPLDKNEALRYVHSAMELSVSNNLNVCISDCYLTFSNLHYTFKNYKEAVNYSLKALSFMKENGIGKEESSLYEILYLSYEALNNIDSSFYYLKKYNSLIEQKKEIDNKGAIIKLEQKKEIESQKKETEQLARIKEDENKINNLNKLAILLSVVLLFTIILIRLIYLKSQQKRNFSNQLIKNIEMDRETLSRELHDNIGNSLLLLNLKSSNHYFSEIQPIIDDVRSMSKHLFPFYIHNAKLSTLITDLIIKLKFQSTINFLYEIDDVKELKDDVKINIYRMIQEVLSNVVKHSKAKNCSISVKSNDSKTVISVFDNGVGFNLNSLKPQSTFGINSLKHRSLIIGARIKISSDKNGTKIIIQLNHG